jgi:hypothetical protein
MEHMLVLINIGANFSGKGSVINGSSIGSIGLNCLPKDQGGLGIMNTKFMNIALMVKWIWRLFKEDLSSSLWHRIISAKYPGATDVFNSSTNGGSPFWRNVHKVNEFFKLGAKYELGDGTRINFWTDWWTGGGPLSVRFPHLFQITQEQNLKVSQAWVMNSWSVRFRRNFSLEDVAS